MKRIVKKFLVSFSAIAALIAASDSTYVEAVTKEDVIAMAQNAGLPQASIQQGLNYLESGTFSTEEYENMIDLLEGYIGETNDKIVDNMSKSEEYSSLTDEEKEEYVSNLTQAQKNQMIKELDQEVQLEIIDEMIDASSALGINVAVDSFTEDTVKLSVWDNDGNIVDVSSIGVSVDNTGIDYTMLVISMALIIFLSVSGITAFALWQKKCIDK